MKLPHNKHNFSLSPAIDFYLSVPGLKTDLVGVFETANLLLV